jgi:hypothetical protein
MIGGGGAAGFLAAVLKTWRLILKPLCVVYDGTSQAPLHIALAIYALF